VRTSKTRPVTARVAFWLIDPLTETLRRSSATMMCDDIDSQYAAACCDFLPWTMAKVCRMGWPGRRCMSGWPGMPLAAG